LRVEIELEHPALAVRRDGGEEHAATVARARLGNSCVRTGVLLQMDAFQHLVELRFRPQLLEEWIDLRVAEPLVVHDARHHHSGYSDSDPEEWPERSSRSF